MNRSQTPETDRQILFSLERISEAFRVLLWEQSKETGLSPIQIQILIFISSHQPEKCRITYLAEEFNLTKATVSDSVKVLIIKGYLSKIINPADSRSFSLALTSLGLATAKQVSGFNDVFSNLMSNISIAEKNNFYNVLHSIIKGLNSSGVISIQRNCLSCRFYTVGKDSHFCRLLNIPLMDYELRMDCAEHEARA
ncbi:MarR family transcriptional regulator [Flavobacterium sp. Sd200]|uniref:MarR family winged helix-turn-helix transcriptional regulator n=1 Tax=Flavobacterium sp. Sd200 TaxID=2692211 RepID=UPI001369ABB1|nr:helix-turn-helix domain-containing protein [Flavobacterium sp. Sd200]MXN90471.1 MarR family transcriptional regulator [Flavobacterium sp. Sd200]